MSRPIEDYALISDSRTAGLVARDGSMDWLCLPRFDSGACFAALLGDERHGRWLIGPASPARETQRRYRDGTLVLETEHATDGGRVRVVDCMRRGERWPAVVRLVEGLSGTVPMRMELVLRFDYGSVVPWVRRIPGALHAIAGPDAVELRTPVKIHGAGLTSVASFEVTRGQTIPFALSWHPSHEAPPAAFDPVETMRATTGWWRGWSKACAYQGPWRSAVVLSLIHI